MRIGIFGTGRMGSGLGKRWAERGHDVLFGSRTPEKASRLAESIGAHARGGSVREAAEFGEAVLLAVPWPAVGETLQVTGPLAGKTLIDCTNPLTVGDGAGLTIGFTTSAGEEVARMASQARVVKAFNAVFAAVIHGDPMIHGERASIFYCGDDADAKRRVATLIEDAGFEPIDAGPLPLARTLEPLTVLLIQLGYVQGLGRGIAMKLLQE